MDGTWGVLIGTVYKTLTRISTITALALVTIAIRRAHVIHAAAHPNFLITNTPIGTYRQSSQYQIN